MPSSSAARDLTPPARASAPSICSRSKAAVRLSDLNGTLKFEVADDGVGFDPAATRRGSGLTNLADRLDALGGKLEINSAPGRGTRLAGTVPAAEAVAATP